MLKDTDSQRRKNQGEKENNKISEEEWIKASRFVEITLEE